MSKEMKAVRLFSPGDVRCVEVKIPEIKNADDVIIKVKSCGVCGSDIPRVMVKGAYRHPITLGHEFSGEAVKIGRDVKTVNVGDRVTVMPLIPCGKCNYCKIGEYHLCDDYLYYGSRIDGAMAEFIRVAAGNILKLPENVDYEAGSMTDPVSVALHSLRNLKIEPGQKAAIFGLGAIGFLAMQWLKILGCSEVYVVDVYEEKLHLAKSLGADLCINAKEKNPVDIILDHTSGKGVDIAFESAGSKITQVQAIDSAKKMAKVIYCGISSDDLLIPNSALNNILRRELTIIGSWNSSISPLPINEWESSLTFMNSGKLIAKPLISHRFQLEDCKECFDMMYKRSEVFNKVLFKPEE